MTNADRTKVTVKPLEWREYRGVHTASTSTGPVCVHAVKHDGSGKIAYAVWDEEEFATVDEAKSAAQADYERRILSALSAAPKPEPAGAVTEGECATEGCRAPAVAHFVRGGVGSTYCLACYLKVQALSLSQPAPQPDAKASGVEGDWVLVPRQPTEAMMRAGADRHSEAMEAEDPECETPDEFAIIYHAMLAAAPTPPTEAGVEEPEVERYTHEYFGGVYSGMTKHPKGEWVHLSEHNAIVEGLKRERDALDRLCDSRFDGIAALNGKLTTERERSGKLQEALQSAADEFDGTISGAERARDIAHAALRELKGGE